MKDLQGGTTSVTWTEKGLVPTPKFAYFQINDNINPAAFSGFYRFTPSVQLTGKALVTDNIHPAMPYEGLTVYLDTNNNGLFDEAEAYQDTNSNGFFDPGEIFSDSHTNGIRDTITEPHTLTNKEGVYYFFDVAPGSHQVGFDLPDNRLPALGSSIITVARGTESITTVPDFHAQWSNPTITGQLFVDTNQNNKRDPNERGAAGAKLIVTDKEGKPVKGPNDQPLVVVTDDEGKYLITLWEEDGTEVTLKLEGTADAGKTIIGPTKEGGRSKQFSGIDYAKPTLFTHDFAVQASYEFQPDPNASILENIHSYLMLFLEGKYSGVNFRTSGFEFLVNRFKLLPLQGNEQGIESAKGQAIFGGQTLGFEFVGPRGFVFNGLGIQEVNLKLSGDFDIFGAKLKLDQLTGRFVAGDTTKGTKDSFQLTGSTTVDMGGNKVSVDLLNKGLVLSADGIESLDLKITANLKIAGTEIDASTLSAIYNRETDQLVLTGATKLLQFGSKKIDNQQGDYLGLENVTLVMGGVTGPGSCRVISLQATVAAGLAIEGANFSVEKLIAAYNFDTDTVQISGSASMDLGNAVLLNAFIPVPGIQFGPMGFSFTAQLSGQVVLAGYTFKLDKSALTYNDSSLQIAVSTSLNVGQDQLTLEEGSLVFAEGRFSRVKGKVSGTLELDQATLELVNLAASLDIERNIFALNGSFRVRLASGQTDVSKDWILVGGSLELASGTISKISGVVQTGNWEIAPGFILQLERLAIEYVAIDQKYRLYGECDANIMGGKVGVGISEPGLVWRNGALESFGGKLTGSLAMDLDGNNHPDFDLAITQMGFLIEKTDPWRVTITGGGLIVYNGWIMAGGRVTTDERGIIFGANGLEHFSLLGSMVFGFGDSFVDTNHNFVRDNNEDYEDRNGDERFTTGIGIVVSNAGISYTFAVPGQTGRLKITGMGRLAFDVGNLAEYPELGTFVDLGKDGIELIDGKVNSFSMVVGANFKIAGLDFQPEGSVGMRYLATPDQWDLYGKINLKISDVRYTLAFGDSLVNSGMQWIHSSIVRADASMGGAVTLGNVGATLKDAGFTWNLARNTWGVFGSIRVSVGTWIEGSLGTRANPGLVVDTSKPGLAGWDLNGLNLAFGGVSLGGFTLDEIKFGFHLVGESFSVVASCGVVINGWGLAGTFSFKDKMIDAIAVELKTSINIPSTPIFITDINGSIKNIDFNDLSKLTFSAQVGVSVGPDIDLGNIPLFGGKYTMAKFVGTAMISPSGMRIQADAHMLARAQGEIGNRKWTGYIAQGTATVNLDWARNEYYADADLTFNYPQITTPLFDGRLRGRITFEGNEPAIRFKAGASLQIAKWVPGLGGDELGSVNLLVNFVPNRQQLNIVAWFDVDVLFGAWKETKGLNWDLWRDRFEVLWDRGDVESRLGEFGQNLKKFALGTAPGSMTPLSMPLIQAGFSMTPNSSMLAGFAYSGTSLPVPETEVSSGEYMARFRVEDANLRLGYQDWIHQVQLVIDPVAGVNFQPISVNFDPLSGLGSIGMRVVPLKGQYLPRGLTLHATLSSPLPLETVHPQLPDLETGPEMEANWTRAVAYSGNLPAIGTDQEGSLIPGLEVSRARYFISFRPETHGLPLPEDWAESIRIYTDPLAGAELLVGRPTYDQATDHWTIELTCRPESHSSIGNKFLTPGLTGKITIRSKVELVGDKEDLGAMASPDIHATWLGEPSEIEQVAIPQIIGTDLRITTLTGRIKDPRITEVKVTLFYSLDEAGEREHSTTLANGELARDIVVPVLPDGSWATDITWDPTLLPSGNLWLYGLVDCADLWQPIYSVSTPFELKHDVEGIVTSPMGLDLDGIGGIDSTLSFPASGVLVYADLNNNGVHESIEPTTHTDEGGHYFMDVDGKPTQLVVRFEIPSHYAPAEGFSSQLLVDLTNGPATANLHMIPTSNILRGTVNVVGKFGQPVPGMGVIASGPDGKTHRVLTDLQGIFEVPVDIGGVYQVRMDFENAHFFQFQLRGVSDYCSITVPNQSESSTIIRLKPIVVDSVGVVTRETLGDDEFQGTLQTLVRQANEGYITTIEFDSMFQGKTFTLTGSSALLAPSFVEFQPETHEWKENPARLPLDHNGLPDDSPLYGPSTFRILDDLKIDGGNLGITLRGDGTSRAFLVRPDVSFGLSNITLTGFASLGANGYLGGSEGTPLTEGSSGGDAGLGGAILNQGITSLNQVTFTNNQSLGGVGGNTLWAPLAKYQSGSVQGGLQQGGSLNGPSLGASFDFSMPYGIIIATPNQAGQSGAGGGYLGGAGGQTIPVTLTYTLGEDPTPLTTTVMLAGAGGGGSGLGGAIYNATGARLTIQGETSFTNNSVYAGKGGIAPEYVTNLANAIFGDYAHTLSVTGFENAFLSGGANGAALGGAIFNRGTMIISDSSFDRNFASDSGAAIYSFRGEVSIRTSALHNNQSPADQGIHYVADSNNPGSLIINNSHIKGKQSFLSGRPMGPGAVVVEGGQSSGSGNIITSKSGFGGSSFFTDVVTRPASPFTGEVFNPWTNGPLAGLGALANKPVLSGNMPPEVAIPFELTFAIPLKAGQPVPLGRLILGIDATSIAGGNLDALGKVTLKLPGMVAKKFTLNVYYEGDAIYAGNIGKKTIAIGTPNQRIVQQLYKDYLGRDADAAGLHQWEARLDSGIPLEQVVREIRLSTESSQIVVQNAFREVLGRSAQTAGLKGWTSYLQRGHTGDDLRAELLASREYQSAHNRQETINGIYQNFLGHDAAQAGIGHWLKNWEAGMSLSQVIQKIRNSQESREYIVDTLYQEILDRPADGLGLDHWTDALEHGLDKDALAAALLHSTVFTG